MKIAYFYAHRFPFVQKDIEMFAQGAQVVHHHADWRQRSRTMLSFVRQLAFLLRHIWSVDVVVMRFGGYWCILPILFARWRGIPSIVIPGGADSVSYPKLQFGGFRLARLRKVLTWCYEQCSAIAPADETLVYSRSTFLTDPVHRDQGIKAFIPHLATPIHVIHNGFDSRRWQSDGSKRVADFITLASVKDPVRARIKGLDLIWAIANEFSDHTFTVIGVREDIAVGFGPAPPNLTCLPFLDHTEIRAHLSRHKFYLQPSRSEGFPNSLCEAMLCECVPIVSAVGAMPEIVGQAGFIVERCAQQAFSERIQEALSLTAEARVEGGRAARSQITPRFDLEVRRAKFAKLFQGLSPRQ